METTFSNVVAAMTGMGVEVACPACGDAAKKDSNGDSEDPSCLCEACGECFDVWVSQ